MSEEQLGFFGPAPGIVGRSHPDTSRAAAQLIAPKTGTQRRRVLDFIAARGEQGATDLEVQAGLRLDGNTERPRRVELVEAGFVADSGARRFQRGRHHVVWIARPAE